LLCVCADCTGDEMMSELPPTEVLMPTLAAPSPCMVKLRASMDMPEVLPVVLPVIAWDSVWFVCAATEPVKVDPFKPKLTPLLLEKVSADKLLLVVPALRFIAADPVITDPFNPNETLLELEKVTLDKLLLVVPAEKFMLVMALWEAVMVDPFSPNETPLLLLKTIADRLPLVVPPERLMFVRLLATEPVITDPFSPKLT
jgi:hypothetical protein